MAQLTKLKDLMGVVTVRVAEEFNCSFMFTYIHSLCVRSSSFCLLV